MSNFHTGSLAYVLVLTSTLFTDGTTQALPRAPPLLVQDDELLNGATGPGDSVCPAVPQVSIAGNMIANPNFVSTDSNGIPCEWSVSGPFSRSTNVTLPGSAASLHYHGTDPKVYTIVKQHVAVVPGVTYSGERSVAAYGI